MKQICGFNTRRKAQHFQCVCVLEKPIGKAGNTDSASGTGHLNPAIAALERLIQQAQVQEERPYGPKYNNGNGIEHTVSELEVDLNMALNALKAKEAELGEAEQAVKADQWEVQRTRSALLIREKELEAAYRDHSIKQEELQRAHEAFLSRSQALRHAEEVSNVSSSRIYIPTSSYDRYHCGSCWRLGPYISNDHLEWKGSNFFHANFSGAV